MKITIGRSLKKKGAAEARKVLEKRYLDSKGPYAKLVSQGKAKSVSKADIDNCIAANFDEDNDTQKAKVNVDSKGDKPTAKATEKKG